MSIAALNQFKDRSSLQSIYARGLNAPYALHEVIQLKMETVGRGFAAVTEPESFRKGLSTDQPVQDYDVRIGASIPLPQSSSSY